VKVDVPIVGDVKNVLRELNKVVEIPRTTLSGFLRYRSGKENTPQRRLGIRTVFSLSI